MLDLRTDEKRRLAMPDINFNCPNCNQNLDAPPEMAGETIECPSCTKAIVIPSPKKPVQAGPKKFMIPNKRPQAPVAEKPVTEEPAPAPSVILGKHRNPLAPILLSIITLGIYSLVWLYKLYKEASLYANNRNGSSITSGGMAIGLLFIPVFNIIWSVILWFKTPGLVSKMRQADGVPADQIGKTASLGFLMLIPVLGGLLWIILTQNAMNSFWKEAKARHGI